MGREPLSILLAVQESDVAQAIVHALSPDDHTVQLAHDAEAAISIADTVQVDCVLLDGRLPGMPPLELARALRGRSLSPLAVIIVLTTPASPVRQDEHGDVDVVIERNASTDPSVTGLIRHLQSVRRRGAHAKRSRGARTDPPIE